MGGRGYAGIGGVWARMGSNSSSSSLFVLEHRGQLPPAWLRGWWWEWWFWWWLVGTAEATSIEASGRMTGGQGLFFSFFLSYFVLYPSKTKSQRDNGTGDGDRGGPGRADVGVSLVVGRCNFWRTDSMETPLRSNKLGVGIALLKIGLDFFGRGNHAEE